MEKYVSKSFLLLNFLKSHKKANHILFSDAKKSNS